MNIPSNRKECGDPHCHRTGRLVLTRKGWRCKKHLDRIIYARPRAKAPS